MTSVRESNIVMLAQRSHACSSPCRDCIQRLRCPAFNQHSTGNSHSADSGGLTQKTVRTGQVVYNAGERFSSLYMVRSGFFKSTFVDSNGDLQITGFYFPGELFGLEGIDTGFHSNTVQALETGNFCRIPLSVSGTLARTEGDDLLSEANTQNGCDMLSLVKVMGGIIARDRAMIFTLGKMCARRRFAVFLLDIADRMQQSGYDRDEFRLCMSRIDMSNYLCLAIETISRLFTQFDELDIIDIDRRNLRIVDRNALLSIVADNDSETALLEKVS